MSNNYLPTKSNLIKLQESLKITKQGHELLERKRLILSKELEKYQDKVGKNRVRNVNTDIGIDNFTNISNGVKIDDYIDIKNKTLMGCEIPSAVHKREVIKRNYGFYNTTHMVDEAIFKFNEIQKKLIEYAILKNTVDRLKRETERVGERANALQNIIIPENEKNLKQISSIIDEREREEFARLKVIKKRMK